MASSALYPLLAAVLVFQSTSAAKPIQLGPTGARLTIDDIADLTRIASEAGGYPWIVLGESPSGPKRTPYPWPVSVFLRADHATGTIRRGRVLRVTASLTSVDDYSSPKSWRLVSSGLWAQVPTGVGQPEGIKNSRDLNRPFAITGAFSDQAIQEIVAIVRGSTRKAPGIEGTWPISAMNLNPDSKVEVYLVGPNASELSGQVVFVQKTTTGWVVLSIAGWAA